MANEIRLKRGSGSDPGASDLVVGEVAVRTDNGTLFTKKDDGNVAEIGAAAGVSDGDKGDITVSNSGSTFTIDSGVISNGNVASNAAIDGSKITPTFTSTVNVTNTLPEIFLTDTNTSNARGRINANGGGLLLGADNDNAAADSVISFAVDGSEKARINASGKVSIANTGLTTSSSADELVIGTTSGNRGLTIFSGTSNTGNIFFGDTDTSGTGNRMGTITYDHSGNFMRFSTDGNQERIRIDSDGLDVTGAITSTGDLTITNEDPKVALTDSGHNPDYHLVNASGVFKIWDNTNSASRFAVNTDGHIDVTGNLDVGAGLDVTGDIIASGDITANGGDMTISGTSPILHLVDTNDNPNYRVQNVNGVFQIYDATSDVSRFNVATNGLVSVPGAFDVNDTLSVTSTAPHIDLVDTNANSDFRLICNSGSFHIEDITNSGNRLSIDSSGDVIIHNDLDFPDSSKIKFGAGDDFELFHNGSQNIIGNTATQLRIITDALRFRSATGSETYGQANVNGGFELHHNNVKKFQTTSSGIDVTGAITSTGKVQAGDDVEVTVSSGDAFIVTKGGTNQGHLVKKADGTTVAAITNGGAVSGSADDCAIFSSSGNVRILAGGNNISNNLILNVTTGGVGVTGNMSITGTVDGRDVASDGTKLDGIESGATADQTASEIVALVADQTIAPSTIDMEDDEKIKLGTGDDLLIFHSGNQNIINGATGQNLEIQTNAFRLRNQADSESMIVANANDSVELYFDNVLKVKTQTDHINIGCNLSSNPFDYLRFGASLFGAADIAPHNAGSHTVGISFRTDSTADTTINPTEALRLSANGAFGPPSNLTQLLGASDMRLKKNIVTLDKGLSAINSLRPVSFNWTDGFCDEQTETLYGFIAQEVQTIDSNLTYQFGSDGKVTFGETTIENALTVNEKFIIPMLVKAVQELTAKVTALES